MEGTLPHPRTLKEALDNFEMACVTLGYMQRNPDATVDDLAAQETGVEARRNQLEAMIAANGRCPN